jgi:uridylate kinase
VDGIYTADPKKDAKARKYGELTYDEVLDRRLAVMDQTAIVLARDHRLPLRVYDMTAPGALLKIARGAKDVGTLVRN